MMRVPMRACLTTAVLLLCVSLAFAGKTWDTGVTMDGEMQDNQIFLPISLESPSTDTMTCDPEDTDHWIDEDQSTPDDEGTDPDAWSSWAATKCWWWTEAGSVSQHSWTTTYTAPETQGGLFPIECSIEDLPKTCDFGTRDDNRAYVGTEQGTGHPDAVVYSAELQKRYSVSGVSVQGSLQFPANRGQTDLCNLTTPSNSFGFFKKVQWVAAITPVANPVDGPAHFEWIQKMIGEGVFNGTVGQRHTSWGDDSPESAYQTDTMDGAGRIYMLDGPGAPRTGTFWTWTTPQPECWLHMRAPDDPSSPVRFINKVKFGGKRISTNYWNTGGQDWTRHLRISKDAGATWQITTNN